MSIEEKLNNFKKPLPMYNNIYRKKPLLPLLHNREVAYKFLKDNEKYIGNDGFIIDSPCVRKLMEAINLYLFDLKIEDTYDILKLKVDHIFIQNSIFSQIWYTISNNLVKIPSLLEICRFSIRKSVANSIGLLREDNHTYSPIFFPLIEYRMNSPHYNYNLVDKINKFIIILPNRLKEYVKLPELDIEKVLYETNSQRMYCPKDEITGKYIQRYIRINSKNNSKDKYFPGLIPSWFIEI